MDNDPYALAYLRVAIERLDPRFHMIWAVSTGAAAIHRCLHTPKPPDVLVSDMSLTDMTGPEVCAALRRGGSTIGVVGITALDPESFADSLARAGGQALVAKEDIPRVLGSAIVKAAQGWSRPESSDGHSQPAAGPDRLGRLSERELAVARLYGRHLTTGEIARALGISESTVHVHMHHAMRKLGVATRQEVIRICQVQHRI
ncbi:MULTISPECIES: response regulator transcription factor [Bifidobacterium]|uniref:response regulator transcription factor n=1 Tax=Bifidobacterium TaxID=1678 RepID=UPI00136248E9|nr:MULTISPECIES: response regulator transcription factor [Bifidobacterium]